MNNEVDVEPGAHGPEVTSEAEGDADKNHHIASKTGRNTG